MFGRKRRKAEPRAAALDAAGAVLAEAPLMEFPISEEAVVALSIEFFNDPEPCEIHRGAVRWRVLQAMKEASGGRAVPVEALEPAIRAALPEDCAVVKVWEAEA